MVKIKKKSEPPYHGMGHMHREMRPCLNDILVRLNVYSVPSMTDFSLSFLSFILHSLSYVILSIFRFPFCSSNRRQAHVLLYCRRSSRRSLL